MQLWIQLALTYSGEGTEVSRVSLSSVLEVVTITWKYWRGPYSMLRLMFRLKILLFTGFLMKVTVEGATARRWMELERGERDQ